MAEKRVMTKATGMGTETVLTDVLARLRATWGGPVGLDPYGTLPEGEANTTWTSGHAPWLVEHGLVVVVPPARVPIAPYVFEATRQARERPITVACIVPSKVKTEWYDVLVSGSDYVAMNRCGEVTVTLTSPREAVRVGFVTNFSGPNWRVLKVVK